jgi:hypothetical protein
LIFYCSIFLLWTIIVDGFFIKIQGIVPGGSNGINENNPETENAKNSAENYTVEDLKPHSGF